MIAVGDGSDPFGPDGDIQPVARHRGKVILVFCDGHTEANRKDRWIAKDVASRSRWNNDNLPH